MASQKEPKIGITANEVEGQFWYLEGKALHVKYGKMLFWLHSEGYALYGGEIVQERNNIVTILGDRDIAGDAVLKARVIDQIESYMADRFYPIVEKIFSRGGGLMAKMRKLEDKFLRDNKEETWLFFKNKALLITKKIGVNPIPYNKINGYVWASSVINRDFYGSNYLKSDAFKFVEILGGKNMDKLCRILGYGLSRYKDPVEPRAIVFTEDVDPSDEGESQGRSGKGLLVQFLKQFRKTAYFNGKNFEPRTNKHFWQDIDLDTNIIFIDDPRRRFDLEDLFSILTEGIHVNKMFKSQLFIPFADAPKVIIASNYSVGKSDDSSKGRQYKFPIVKYFSASLTPKMHFGKEFFINWNKQDWLMFDSFMAQCALDYLTHDNHTEMNVTTADSLERELISETNSEFIDYMDRQLKLAFFDFAPDTLKNLSIEHEDMHYSNAVNYSKWLENMGSKNPNRSEQIIIDRDKLWEKAIFASKYKDLKKPTATTWLKKWADSRSLKINTRAGDKKEILVMDFPNPYKTNGETPPF